MKPRSSARDSDITAGVARRVRALRLSRGMTQPVLAAAVGVTYQQMHKYETAVNQTSLPILTRIAAALRVPVTDLITGTVDLAEPTDSSTLRLLRIAGRLSPERRLELVAIANVLAGGES